MIRKYCILSIVVLSLVIPLSSASAIGIGGSIIPAGEKNFILSITPVYQSRNMKDESTGQIRGKSRERGIYVNGVYGFYKDFDVFVKWGGFKNEFESTTRSATYEAKAWKFSSGGGVRGVPVVFSNGIHIGLYGQYFRQGRYDYGSSSLAAGEFLHSRIEIMDGGMYLYKEILGWVPYIGGRYSDQRIDFEPRGSLVFEDYQPAGRAGLFLGIEKKFDNHWGGMFEGRLIDETAMEGSIYYRF